MGAVPPEMIEEILVRLAVKSLLRFKCVSRRWCGLIQSGRFIDRHYSHDSNQDRLVFRTGEYVEGRFEEGHGACDRLLLPYFGEDFNHRMGPVLGLLCEVSSVSGDIVLLNPATHKVKRVPPLPSVFQSLMYELSFGFGFDPLSGDYKIVVFRRDAATFAFVYNSRSDCWKRVEVVGSCPVIKASPFRGRFDGAFSNGVCYWVVERGGVNNILAFDMMSEKFREIKVPHCVCVANPAAYGDSIALMSCLNGYELWVMGKQGIWSKILTFDNLVPCWWTECVWKNEILFWSFRVGSFILLDVTTQKITSLPQHLKNINPHPFCYKESLVSINGEQDV